MAERQLSQATWFHIHLRVLHVAIFLANVGLASALVVNHYWWGAIFYLVAIRHLLLLVPGMRKVIKTGSRRIRAAEKSPEF